MSDLTRFAEHCRRMAADCGPWPVSLTPAQQRVLDGLTAGLTATEIAAAGHVTVDTVRSHIRALREKYGVHTQGAVVAAARQQQLWTQLADEVDDYLARRDALVEIPQPALDFAESA